MRGIRTYSTVAQVVSDQEQAAIFAQALIDSGLDQSEIDQLLSEVALCDQAFVTRVTDNLSRLRQASEQVQ